MEQRQQKPKYCADCGQRLPHDDRKLKDDLINLCYSSDPTRRMAVAVLLRSAGFSPRDFILWDPSKRVRMVLQHVPGEIIRQRVAALPSEPAYEPKPGHVVPLRPPPKPSVRINVIRPPTVRIGMKPTKRRYTRMLDKALDKAKIEQAAREALRPFEKPYTWGEGQALLAILDNHDSGAGADLPPIMVTESLELTQREEHVYFEDEWSGIHKSIFDCYEPEPYKPWWRNYAAYMPPPKRKPWMYKKGPAWHAKRKRDDDGPT